MAEISRGTLRAYDAGTHTATVQLHESRSSYATSIPVNRAILAADMTAGRACLVVFPNPGDASDAQLISIY
ncbi:MAG: hypothetical protein EPO26_10860 [Chloroflexota bacterium]|nr:MAG: hypothetical protein EPO26_10860 [Chloroflexota bacterium]